MALVTTLRNAEADPLGLGLGLLDADPDGSGSFDEVRITSDFNPPDGDVADALEDVRFWRSQDTLYASWQDVRQRDCPWCGRVQPHVRILRRRGERAHHDGRRGSRPIRTGDDRDGRNRTGPGSHARRKRAAQEPNRMRGTRSGTALPMALLAVVVLTLAMSGTWVIVVGERKVTTAREEAARAILLAEAAATHAEAVVGGPLSSVSTNALLWGGDLTASTVDDGILVGHGLTGSDVIADTGRVLLEGPLLRDSGG